MNIYGADRLCITMAFCGGPGAAVTLGELYAMGCNKFIICGGAGALKKDSKVEEGMDYMPEDYVKHEDDRE